MATKHVDKINTANPMHEKSYNDWKPKNQQGA